MKNLFVIPTMGMSTLYKRNDLGTYHIGPFELCLTGDLLRTNQYVYVTNDEDINDNDYIITKDGRLVQVSYLLSEDLIGGTKVVMTNDPTLIGEGVERISETFFDWFVDNSDCEEVEITRPNKCKVVGCDLECIFIKTCENIYYGYEIIIPTFEENVERELSFIHKSYRNSDFDLGFKTGMILGDKSKQPILYDESEVLELLLNRPGPYLTDDEIKEWFNDVKKK